MTVIIATRRTTCNHCGGPIDFDSADLGKTIECYHCGLVTLLLAEASGCETPDSLKTGASSSVGIPKLAYYGRWEMAVLGLMAVVAFVHMFFIAVILFPGLFDRSWHSVLEQFLRL